MATQVPTNKPAGSVKPAAKDANENLDPITGEPGAHPLGTSIGAASGGIAAGAATGASIGTIAGPVGTAVGGVIGIAAGALLGGLAGKSVAEAINPTVEHEYWRSNYAERPYVRKGTPYADYETAYQTGWESEYRHQDKSFDEVEAQLQQDWSAGRGNSPLDWERAKPAVRDAWERARERAADAEANGG